VQEFPKDFDPHRFYPPFESPMVFPAANIFSASCQKHRCNEGQALIESLTPFLFLSASFFTPSFFLHRGHFPTQLATLL